MTGNPRRSGFRLPWTADQGDTEPSAETDSVEGQPSDAPSSAPASAEPIVATSERVVSTAPATTDATGASPSPDAAAAPSPDAASAPSPDAAAAPAAEPAPPATAAAASDADAAGSDADAETTLAPDAFLRELVDAMRSVADNARDANLGELREQAEQRARQLAADSEQRIDALRASADADVTGIGDWAAAEAERIRAEAERRVSERRSQLDHELAAEAQRAQDELSSMQGRVADYERELQSFHAQLSEIADPAAFAAAAKRIPSPPSLVPAIADNGTTRAPAEATSVPGGPTDGGIVGGPPPAAAPVEAPAPVPEATAPETAPAPAVSTPSASANEAQGGSRSAPVPESVAVAAGAEPSERQEADSAPADADAPAIANEPTSGPAQTAVVVRGLSSFGAITGFRQSLAAAEGVEAVNLSLGPTGEFLYRATHAEGFDLAAAIRHIEGEGAEIQKDAGGTLHVTISRGR